MDPWREFENIPYLGLCMRMKFPLTKIVAGDETWVHGHSRTKIAKSSPELIPWVTPAVKWSAKFRAGNKRFPVFF